MTAFASLGFIGLGVMGEGMAANVVAKAGVPVYGFDLDAGKVDRLSRAGMIGCASVEEVADAAELVFLSLPAAAQVSEVCDRLLAAPGRLRAVVDMSTAPASLARSLNARCAASGLDFIDAPVARLRQAARDGTLSIMVGATPEQFTAIEPYLRFMGSDVSHCGPSGSGQVVKILNNMVVFMTVHALAEALAVGRAQGLDGKTLFDVLSLGSADSFMLRNAGMGALVPEVFPPATFPTTYALKDIGYALDLAEEVQLDLPGAHATQALLEATRGAGFEREYYPVFLKLLQRRREAAP
ncbi:NAD(P)-dependent oxidoreductase [uncultured Sphingomonas sp.]|uniref:NAD(P)-dependent oxidoreductase n=1 Tax=uncultured Sphingomonas sp. TaxID=158754 RepID=UPI0035C9B711